MLIINSVNLLRVSKLKTTSQLKNKTKQNERIFSLLYLHQLVQWIFVKIAENFQPCLAANTIRE